MTISLLGTHSIHTKSAADKKEISRGNTCGTDLFRAEGGTLTLLHTFKTNGFLIFGFRTLVLAILAIVLLETAVLGLLAIFWAQTTPWVAPMVLIVAFGAVSGTAILTFSVYRELRGMPLRRTRTIAILVLFGGLAGFGPEWFWYIQFVVNKNFNVLTIGSSILSSINLFLAFRYFVLWLLEFRKPKSDRLMS